jgi:hypothetical protein
LRNDRGLDRDNNETAYHMSVEWLASGHLVGRPDLVERWLTY